MNEPDDIPILNALGERLMAGIAANGARPRRPIAAVVIAAVVVVIAAVLVVAAQPGAKTHHVIVLGPAPALAHAPAAASTAGAVAGATPSTTPASTPAGGPLTTDSTTPRAATTTTIAPVTRTTAPSTTAIPAVVPTTTPVTTSGATVDLGRTDSGRSLTVAPGTTIDVNLVYDGTQCGMAWSNVASSDSAVLTPSRGGVSGPNDQVTFRAAGPGTASITATGAPYGTEVGVACPMFAQLWSVTVTVS